MQEGDWYWRRGLLLAAWALGTLAAFAYWYLRWTLPLDGRLSAPLVPDTILAADVAVSLALVALCVVRDARVSRSRMALRAAAMSGAPEAMPLANIPLPPTESALVPMPDLPPDLAEYRVGVRWWLFALIRVCAVFYVGVVVELTWHLLIPALVAPIQGHGANGHAIPAHGAALMLTIAIIGGLVWLIVTAGGIILLTFEPTPSSICLTADGFMVRSRWGRERVVHWHELRLIEVATGFVSTGNKGPGHRTYQFTLSGGSVPVSWWELTGTDGTLSPRSQLWLHVLRQRAGLEPRTLDRALLAPGASPVPSPRPPLVPVILPAYAAVAGITSGLAPAGPLVSYGPVFLTLGAFCALMAVVMLSMPLWLRWLNRDSSSAHETNGPPARALPPPRPPAPGEVYEFACYVGPTVGQCRLLYAATGLIYLAGVALVFFVIAGPCYVPMGSLRCTPINAAGWIGFAMVAGLSVLLILCAMLGRPAVLFRQGQRSVRAESMGVNAPRWSFSSRWRQSIPWERIAAVDLVRISGKGWMYQVTRDDGMLMLTWPKPKRPRPAPPTAPGATWLGADEIAALIAERSGRSLDGPRT